MAELDFGQKLDPMVYRKDQQNKLDIAERALERKQAFLTTFLSIKAKNAEIFRRLKQNRNELSHLMLNVFPSCNQIFAQEYVDLLSSGLDVSNPQQPKGP